VAVQLAQVVRGAGEKPFVLASGQAAPGHHGDFLAGLELPEYWLDGDAGPGSRLRSDRELLADDLLVGRADRRGYALLLTPN